MKAALDKRVKHSPMLAADSRFVFVAVGKFTETYGMRVAWLKTDVAILYAPCDYCPAKKGEPCFDERGEPKTGTHWTRRRDAGNTIQARATCRP